MADEQSLLELQPNSPVVIKRDHSDVARHCYILNDLPQRSRLQRIIREVTSSSDLWLIQDYVKELKMVGEWRFFIVDNELYYGIYTRPHRTTAGTDMKINTFESVPPLQGTW